MNAHLGQWLSGVLTGLSVLGAALPVLAQATPPVYTFSPAPVLPSGDGWRPVNPQPLPGSGSQFNLQSTLLLRSGDIIPVTYQGDTVLYIAPGETRPISLTLSSPIRDPRGNPVVPVGAVITGQFQSANGGTQFVAQSVSINNQSYPLSAQSSVIKNQRDPRETSAEAIAGDALIGAAAGALLGGVFGNQVISTEKVLGGAAAGAVIGNVTAPDVAVINTNAPLNLTVTQDFQPALP